MTVDETEASVKIQVVEVNASGGDRGLETHVLCQSSSPYSGPARSQVC